jgi:MYXO-CTERM domain-containing protein
VRNWKMLAALGVVALGTAHTSFAANTSYFFSGVCPGCTTTATATLVLSNYTLGTAVTGANLVSFTFNGTNLTSAFTITPSSPGFAVAGSVNAFPANVPITIQGNGITFFSNVGAGWGAAGVIGTNAVWSTTAPGAVPSTPAPPTSVLLAIALLALSAFVLWRRRATISA